MSFKNWLLKLLGKAEKPSVNPSEQPQTQEGETEMEKIPVTGVTLAVSRVDLYVNQSFQLMKTVQPANATDNRVFWSTSNPSVASVDSSGVVTALKPGCSTIHVQSMDGSFSATATVDVSSIVLRGELKTPVNGDKFADLPDALEMNGLWAGGTSVRVFPFKQNGNELTPLSSRCVRLAVLPGTGVRTTILDDAEGTPCVRIHWPPRNEEAVTIQVMDSESGNIMYSRTVTIKV